MNADRARFLKKNVLHPFTLVIYAHQKWPDLMKMYTLRNSYQNDKGPTIRGMGVMIDYSHPQRYFLYLSLLVLHEITIFNHFSYLTIPKPVHLQKFHITYVPQPFYSVSLLVFLRVTFSLLP